jgi:hypothetical protein
MAKPRDSEVDAWSSTEGRERDREDRAATIALEQKLSLMPAHDCLLYEDVPGSFAEPRLDSPGREDQAQAGDQSSAQEHQRAYDAYADTG